MAVTGAVQADVDLAAKRLGASKFGAVSVANSLNFTKPVMSSVPTGGVASISITRVNLIGAVSVRISKVGGAVEDFPWGSETVYDAGSAAMVKTGLAAGTYSGWIKAGAFYQSFAGIVVT